MDSVGNVGNVRKVGSVERWGAKFLLGFVPQPNLHLLQHLKCVILVGKQFCYGIKPNSF